MTFISLNALEKIEPTTERLIGFPFDFRGTATVDLPLAASDITALNTPITDTNRNKDNFMATVSRLLVSEVMDSSSKALKLWGSNSAICSPTNVKEMAEDRALVKLNTIHFRDIEAKIQKSQLFR